MSTIGEKIKHELRALIPVILYFLVTFELLALTQTLMLKEFGISVYTFLEAAVAALVVAKVVLIADYIPAVNRFPDKPLAYNVVWKTAIYFVGSFVVRYVEHLVHFWRTSATVSEANHRLLSETSWPRFWAVQIWLLILLLTYCAFRELVNALGRKRILTMFFHEPVKPINEG